MADYGRAALSQVEKSGVKGLLSTGLNKWIYAVSQAVRENKPLNVVCALDSLTQNTGSTSYVDFLRPKLQSVLGDGGAGFVAFNTTQVVTEKGLFGIGGGGSEKTNAHFDGANDGIYDPNLYHAEFTGATNGYVNIKDKEHIFNTADCYYLKKPNGGTFKWSDVNFPSGFKTVDTNYATKEIGIISYPGMPSTLGNYMQATGITGDVHLIGANLIRGTKGVRVHRLAQGGTKAQQVAQLDGTTYTNFLKSIGCDLYILNGGMNDSGASVTVDQYDQYMRTILTRVRAANPNAAILLLFMNDTSDTVTRNVVLENYRLKLLKIALDFDAQIFDSRWVIGNYAKASSKGFMGDGVHPNTTGNTLLGQAIFNYIGGNYLADIDNVLLG